ncbi:glycoside hydrolase family 3 protein [Spirochaeta africana]|uniref:beta-N-acetylhexosaminidase n=1 Tax=Spirochaeta africana (strain ATCC 700263 / DSM 8902 / Z-7692) TaxID=889378 RepID=H9UH93_SPIAZ|nr:glycoside hydrolase family 3 protein [Spirochaeta africana]AFG36886.1 beta-glucosidase-like glycosyl hydrolase [Spirochaeta africana DSM 8902]
MKPHCILPSCILLFALLPCLLSAEAPVFGDDFADIDEHVEQLLSQMSDYERAAQVLMIGWPTVDPSDELMRWIRERNVGSIKIFGWNGNDVPALARSIGQMQAAALEQGVGIPLITSTDQEGGWVRHIKDLTSITPGNMAIGASGLAYDAYQSGYHIAHELRLMGVNMNLAPTVDVYTHPEAHVIGPRAFSDDPVQTGLLGTAFYHGHRDQQVIATGKHYPGHGGVAGDSHLMLPSIDIPMEELWERDLLPFRMLINEGIPALLSGHLSFPAITGDDTPASFSAFFNRQLLREELGFDGIIITDDLYMYGAVDYGHQYGEDIADLVVRAIRSGNDMVMLSRTPDFNGRIWHTLLNTYRQDPEFQSILDDAVRRILRVKLTYLHDPETRVPLIPEYTELHTSMPSPETRKFFQEQAARGTTLLGDRLLPLDGSERVLLAGHNAAFFRIGREFFPNAEEFRFQTRYFYFSSARDRERMRELAPHYDRIIFALGDLNSAQVLAEIEEYQDAVIVFSLLSPIYLLDKPWVHSGVAVYGWFDDSVRAGFSILTGSTEAGGSLPIQNLMGDRP